MKVLETERLILRHLAARDAAFILELLNDPAWIRFIGDRGVRTLAEAADYIDRGPVAMYASHGFGLYLTELKADSAPIGICGLIKRDFLEDVDLGFALLPGYRGRGYAREAVGAVLLYAQAILGLTRLVAITSKENDISASLLEKVGFRFERMMEYPGDAKPVRLFSRDGSRQGETRTSVVFTSCR